MSLQTPSVVGYQFFITLRFCEFWGLKVCCWNGQVCKLHLKYKSDSVFSRANLLRFLWTLLPTLIAKFPFFAQMSLNMLGTYWIDFKVVAKSFSSALKGQGYGYRIWPKSNAHMIEWALWWMPNEFLLGCRGRE